MKVTNILSNVHQKYAAIKLRNSSMNKLNVNFFYDLGSHLAPITKAIPSTKNETEIILHAYYIKGALEGLFRAFPWMKVCKKAAPGFISALDVCMKPRGEGTNDGTKSIGYEFLELQEEAKKFESILAAELQTLEAYVTTQKGGYNTTDLIENAEIILSESILAKIGDRSIDEIRYSGRCLVFDSPTASGFHILRATELVLHQYYLAVCRPECKKVLDAWGAYIAALNTVSESKPDIKKTVALLQLLKDSDRNLIMHPEVVLTPDQAFTLFETAKSIIMAMAERLPAVKKKREHKKRTKKT